MDSTHTHSRASAVNTLGDGCGGRARSAVYAYTSACDTRWYHLLDRAGKVCNGYFTAGELALWLPWLPVVE